MRILVIAMAGSIHTVRWLQQFDGDSDKQIFLFPSTAADASASFKSWRRLLWVLPFWGRFSRSLIVHIPVNKFNTLLHLLFKYVYGPDWRVKWLADTIRRVQPDIIHTLEFQHAGYTCLKAKKLLNQRFPVWIATNWGSDIYLYSQIKGHIEPIKEILREADFYSAECRRDYDLARSLSMTAQPLPVIPNAGGLHLKPLWDLREIIVPSKRKLLLIKGCQMVFGRALTVLNAIELIADDLKRAGIKICMFSVTPDIEIAIELFVNRTGLDIEVHTTARALVHDDMMQLHSNARCYVGHSISDGISTSMLEAMALGAFPIQTCTSCANEWIEDGVSGFISSVDDEKALSQLILRALTDDALVDLASKSNWRTLQDKADYDSVRDIARGFYKTAYACSVETH